MEPSPEEPLSYQPRRPGERGSRWWHPTRPARLAAGVCCALFAALTLYLWVVDGGRGLSFRPHPAAGWAATMTSAAASAFCLLVALGTLGQHRDDG